MAKSNKPTLNDVANSFGLDPHDYYTREWSEDNPYAGYDPSDDLSGWNRFTDALGFTNHYGRLVNEAYLNANQWESSHSLAMEDREYNDYQSEVDRMQAAGINPDFQNISGGSSALAAGTAAGQKSDARAAVAASSPAAFIQTAAGVISSAMSVVNGFNTIRNANLAGDIASYNAVKDDVFSSAAGNVAEHFLGGGLSDEVVNHFVNTGDFSHAFTDAAGNFDRTVFNRMFMSSLPTNMSKRGRRMAEQRFYQMLNSSDFKAAVLQKFTNVKNSQKNAAEALAQIRAADDDIVQVMTDVTVPLYRLTIRKNHFEADYWNTASGTQAASTFNSANQAEQQGYDAQKDVRSAYARIVSNLAKDARDESLSGVQRVFANALLLGFLGLQNASFSRSSGPKGVSTSFGF